MIKQLEFTFLTTKEKHDIMGSVPERNIVESIGESILVNRSFKDNHSKIIFEDELKRLVSSRSFGKPKKMKKPIRKSPVTYFKK